MPGIIEVSKGSGVALGRVIASGTRVQISLSKEIKIPSTFEAGRGFVGRVVVSNARGPRFDTHQLQAKWSDNFEKTKLKE